MIQPEPLKKSTPLLWSVGTGTEVWTLFCACISGDVATVQALLTHKPELVDASHGYRSPLYFAVRENQVDIVRLLLDRGADPLSFVVNDSLLDICRDRGYSELQGFLESTMSSKYAISAGGEEIAAAIRSRDLQKICNLLDRAPELLEAGDQRSNKPIHWAAMTRQLDVIDELVRRGADINSYRADNATPMQLANGDYHFRGWRDVPADWPVRPLDVIAHLRLRGAICDICTACHIGDEAQVQEWLRSNPEMANQCSGYVSYYQGGGVPLKNAASSGHMAIVKLLLAAGADPNLPEPGIAPRGHALYSAVANRHFEIAKLLLEHGAEANAPVESSADALSRAISNNDQPMIELLCSYGAARALELLAYDGDVETAAAVFAANSSSANDPDALATAAGEGQEAFVRLMLRYEPRLPERVEFPGWVSTGKTLELNELLFQHGMNPSQPDWLLTTPLHQLARKGEVEKALQFIEHGANLHARDEDICSTPLGWAAKFGQLDMVKMLLSRGAMAKHPDDPAWATPLAWAMRRGHKDIMAVLKSHQ
jgi:ankyrin repeat protein